MEADFTISRLEKLCVTINNLRFLPMPNLYIFVQTMAVEKLTVVLADPAAEGAEVKLSEQFIKNITLRPIVS